MPSPTRSELLEVLSEIAQSTAAQDEAQIRYNLDYWSFILSEKNPLWKHLEYTILIHDDRGDRACIMVFSDKRIKNRVFLGFFGASNVEIGNKILTEAAAFAKASYTAKHIIGPIDGGTIFGYRLNLNDTFSFAGEPCNPAFYVECFKKAGFTVKNTYNSASTTTRNIQFLRRFQKRASSDSSNLIVRDIDYDQQQRDLAITHDLSVKVFAHLAEYNVTFDIEEYRYITQKAFDKDSDHILKILELDGIVIGAALAYPSSDEAFVVKTVGILPEYQGRGLSRPLINAVHDHAISSGYKTLIYALIRDNSKIRRYSRPGVKVMGRYVTMEKALD